MTVYLAGHSKALLQEVKKCRTTTSTKFGISLREIMGSFEGIFTGQTIVPLLGDQFKGEVDDLIMIQGLWA